MIRPVVGSDANDLVDLLASLGFPAPLEEVDERLQRLMEANEAVLVAAGGDRLLGFVSIHVTPVLHRAASVGRLTALVVAPDHRRRGIGRTLVEAAEVLLIARGCEMIEITSNLKLTEAHEFYERLGYARTSYRFAKRVQGASTAC